MLKDKIVFLPDRRRVSVKHVALISGGFFIIVQLLFLESLEIRLSFTLIFAVFLLLGFWLSDRNSRIWPQKIVINRLGICYDKMKRQYGVDFIPWNEIAHMDLFYSNHRLPPHLRIGLRPGGFSDQVKKPHLQSLSMGLDVNIPVSVNVKPEEVLRTARQFWKEAEKIRS